MEHMRKHMHDRGNERPAFVFLLAFMTAEPFVFFLRYDQRLGGSIVVFSSKETLDGIRVLTKSFLLNKQVALKGRPKPRNVSGNAECAKPLKKKKTESQLCKTKS